MLLYEHFRGMRSNQIALTAQNQPGFFAESNVLFGGLADFFQEPRFGPQLRRYRLETQSKHSSKVAAFTQECFRTVAETSAGRFKTDRLIRLQRPEDVEPS